MGIVNVQYKGTSPYYHTPLFDNKFLDILNYKTLQPHADDIYKPIGVTYQYRPDMMAFDLYGSSDWWWVFIMRNRDSLLDPVWDFTADKKIYIPKLSTILEYIG